MSTTPDSPGSAPELGPVADTVALYDAVRRMRAAPIGRRGVVPVAVAVALPVIAVFATQVPLRQLAAKLLVPLGL